MTSLERAFAPKQVSHEEADRPFFAGGRVFMAERNGLQFVHAVLPDGTRDQQVLDHAILFLTSVSPDGQWIVTWEVDDRAKSSEEARMNRIVAHPLAAGAKVVHITEGGFGPASEAAPLMYWSRDGKFLHYSGVLWGGKAESYALALLPGRMMPDGLLSGNPLFKVSKQARVFHAAGASFNANLSKLIYARRSSKAKPVSRGGLAGITPITIAVYRAASGVVSVTPDHPISSAWRRLPWAAALTALFAFRLFFGLASDPFL